MEHGLNSGEVIVGKALTATAAVGLKVRTGRAVVVILEGTRAAPAIALRHEIELADAWVPESLHPYHQELGDAGAAGAVARRRGCAAARRATRRAIRKLVKEARAHGFQPRGAGVVARSLVDPALVAGAHARAHVEDDRLYHEAVKDALAACDLRVATFLEGDLRRAAVERLGRTPREIDASLRAFSHVVGTPWRALEKNAALAAWLSLRARSRP